MFKPFIPLMAAFLVLSTFFFAAAQVQDAQTAPSVPDFTLQTDKDDGATIILLTIQNQFFDAASYPIDGFCYNVRIRTGGGNWSELYTAEDWYPEQSNASTTVFTYTAGETAYLQRETSQGHPIIPTSGTVEFEVQAMIGHRDRGDLIPGTMIMPYMFVGVTSSWSQPQTVNLDAVATPTSTSTATPVPSGKPDALSWGLLVLLAVLATGLMGAAVVLKRRSSKKENEQTES